MRRVTVDMRNGNGDMRSANTRLRADSEEEPFRWSTERRAGIVAVLLALVVTGCLPHGCQRQTEDALFPADSLSRQIATAVMPDTLTLAWRSTGPTDAPLDYPRTVRFVPSDDTTADPRIVVTDAEQNRLVWFENDGTVAGETRDDAFDVPYVAGTRGDSVVVFNAGADRFDVVTARDGRVPERSVAFQRPAEETLVYTAATDSSFYAKVVGEETEGMLARYDAAGRLQARTSLDGPHWRDAGFVRVWGDSLLSLSGFRPVVDVVPADFSDGAQLDSMRLVGFDSPMLERSYAYAQGDATQAPLLSVSAEAAGPWLFVLNLRPGWVRIDAYDRDGRLRHVLEPPVRSDARNFYPLDLAARQTSDGYVFAVVLRSPEPRLDVYRWPGPTTGEAPQNERHVRNGRTD